MAKRRVAIALAAACLAAVAVAFKTAQSPHDNHRIAKNVFRAAHAMPKVGEPGDETAEALNAAEQYAQARMAPGLVLPGAYSAAFTARTSARHRQSCRHALGDLSVVSHSVIADSRSGRGRRRVAMRQMRPTLGYCAAGSTCQLRFMACRARSPRWVAGRERCIHLGR